MQRSIPLQAFYPFFGNTRKSTTEGDLTPGSRRTFSWPDWCQSALARLGLWRERCFISGYGDIGGYRVRSGI